MVTFGSAMGAQPAERAERDRHDVFEAVPRAFMPAYCYTAANYDPQLRPDVKGACGTGSRYSDQT